MQSTRTTTDETANIVSPSPSDLHEAILANSFQVVKMYLAQGADPNISPLLPPAGALARIHDNQVQDLHRTLNRVFRSSRDGTINPLTVAVCNAYHNMMNGKEDALRIIRLLLKAGADPSTTCSGITFCNVGGYQSLTIASPKTAYKVALFLKRFPLTEESFEICSDLMDDIATILLSSSYSSRTNNEKRLAPSSQDDNATSMVPRQVYSIWEDLSKNEESSFSDLVFVCSDGRVNAHKCVLGTATSYFDAIFQKDGSSENNSSSFEYSINHKSSHILKVVLKYVYTGLLPSTNKEQNFSFWSDVLSVALELQLDSLAKACENHLGSTLLNSPESCRSALGLSRLYTLSNLWVKCLEYILENSATVLLHPAFIKLADEDQSLWNDLAIALNALQNDSTDDKRKLNNSSIDEDRKECDHCRPNKRHRRLFQTAAIQA